uniref:RING-type E3 ubiquitin transferase n=1 Tax=Ditylenchus dipsaci TaxID=166011 RepID=A0A915E4W5_9BILA
MKTRSGVKKTEGVKDDDKIYSLKEEQPAAVQNGNQERMAQALEALAQAQNQLAQELNNLQQPPPAAVANNPAEAVVLANVEDAQRIVDDFTWQRLLGFDGTLAFVEHVVWTILLNVVFNVVFYDPTTSDPASKEINSLNDALLFHHSACGVLPTKLIRFTFPSILPYVFTATADTPLGEFSLELISLQIVMPTILEYSKAFSILKRLVRLWCRVVGGWLGLDSYLLPSKARTAGGGGAAPANNQPRNARRRLADNEANADQAPEEEGPLAVAAPQPEDLEVDGLEIDEVEVVEQEEEELLVALPEAAVEPVAAAPAAAVANNNNNHLAARHQALLMMREPTKHEAYKKPEWFGARIAGLLVCLAVTAVIISYLFFLLPVSLGRALLSYLAVGGGVPLNCLASSPSTTGCHSPACAHSIHAWLLFPVAGSGPLREWAMGVVHFKIFCASVLMGPDWWLKTVFEQVYADAVRGFRLQQLYVQLIVPIVNLLSFQIAFPYVLAKLMFNFLFCLDVSREEEVILTRYTYPCTLLTVTLALFLYWQWSKLREVAQKIRNDKYLIGGYIPKKRSEYLSNLNQILTSTQLVNFYREVNNAVSASTSTGTAEAAGSKKVD